MTALLEAPPVEPIPVTPPAVLTYTVSRVELRDALAIVSRSAGRLHGWEALIRLHRKGGRLTMYGSDIEHSTRAIIEVDSTDESDIAVPATLFLNAVSSLPGDEVAIVEREKAIIVKSGATVFTIPAVGPEQFPEVPTTPMPPAGMVTGAILRTLLQRTVVAAANDPTRPQYCTVCLDFDPEELPGGLRAVATDGVIQVAITQAPMLTPSVTTSDGGKIAPARFTALLPVEVARELTRTLPDDDTPVTIQAKRLESGSASSISFSFVHPQTDDNVEIRSRCVEGAFAPYRRVIPDLETVSVSARVSCPDLLRSLRRLAFVDAGQAARPTYFVFSVDRILLSCGDAARGTASDSVPAVLTGEPGKYMRLAAAHLVKVVALMGEEADFHVPDSHLHPIILQTPAPDFYQYVQSPMHVTADKPEGAA